MKRLQAPLGLNVTPEVQEYLTLLVTQIEDRLNSIEKRMQDRGRLLELLLINEVDVTGGDFLIRPPDYPKMAYMPNYNGDAALIITDGTGVRVITLGPAI